MPKIPKLSLAACALMGGMTLVGATEWTGYVFDGETRAPVVGALVNTSTGKSVLTDATGAYLVPDPTTSLAHGSSEAWDPASQMLSLELNGSERLRLEVFDLAGRLLSRPVDRIVGSGHWNWSANSLRFGMGPLVLRLTRGGQVRSWTVLPGRSRLAASARDALSPRLAAASVDTFVVSKAGYDSAKVQAMDGMVAVDTVWLAPSMATGEISWSSAIAYGSLKDARDNKTYRTTRIGTQNWMAQNLNFKPAGLDSGWCPGNKLDSCQKYGRFYDWTTAMAGWLANPALARPATGICPTGWHLPSEKEWALLETAVGGSQKASRVLKSISGWRNFRNGTDAYGFRGLPAGMHLLGADTLTGLAANWWSSTPGSSDSMAMSRQILETFASLARGASEPGLSVRCVEGALVRPKDTILTGLTLSSGRGKSLAPVFNPAIQEYTDTIPWTISVVTVTGKALDTATSSVWIQGVKGNLKYVAMGANGTVTTITVTVRSELAGGDGDSLRYRIKVYRQIEPSNFGIPWQPGTYGTLYDARDGNVYRTVGGWMAQNLNYKVPGSDSGACLSNSQDTCAKYGRMYQWATAMKGADYSDLVPSGVQGICPGGWHVPSAGEWDELENSNYPPHTSLEFKSLAGWPSPYTLNGTDAMGFRALPARLPHSEPGFKAEEEAAWWTTTKIDVVSSPGSYPTGTYPEIFALQHGFTYPDPTPHDASIGFPLRCVKNK